MMQQEVELSKQRHEGDLKEKERLARMMGNKVNMDNLFGFSNVFCHHLRQIVFSIFFFLQTFGGYYRL